MALARIEEAGEAGEAGEARATSMSGEGTEPGRTSRSRKGLGSCEPETRQGPDTGSAPVATLTGAPGRLATAARLQSQKFLAILKVRSLMLKVIIVLVTQLCSMSRI